MKVPKVTTIEFDFDSYDFWIGWDEEDLEKVDTSESMRKYFLTLAGQVAEPWKVEWTADWSRESGTGHRVCITFENGNVDGIWEVQQQIEDEMAYRSIEYNDWVVYKEET